ncbi:hypothetical protein PVK06_026607 [Gossypium arboreum]|uniref:Uncharacterized protein n=1 Tax=Gossypium arboreum TaxID=29729 RepID=A0ABR0NY78_GOSAR|nr:hypothetical protein PVK06_026607 [Gossypium arboreum]
MVAIGSVCPICLFYSDEPYEGLIELLEHQRRQDRAYIGCMKAGEVVSEEGKLWYEPEEWKFGDEKS